MSTLYVKDFSDDLYAALKTIAEEQERERPGQVKWFLAWCVSAYYSEGQERLRLLDQFPSPKPEEVVS